MSRDQVTHPHKTTGKIIFKYILIFIFLGGKLEDKLFCTGRQQETLMAHTTAHLFVIHIFHPTCFDSINESSSGALFIFLMSRHTNN
jgi:hypothetical protein